MRGASSPRLHNHRLGLQIPGLAFWGGVRKRASFLPYICAFHPMREYTYPAFNYADATGRALAVRSASLIPLISDEYEQ
jgi:hypothetical protein